MENKLRHRSLLDLYDWQAEEIRYLWGALGGALSSSSR